MEPKFVNEYNLTLEMYQEWAKHPVGAYAVKSRKKGICLRIGLICISILLIIDGIFLKEYFMSLAGMIFLVIALNRLLFLPKKIVKMQYDLMLKAYNTNQCRRKIVFTDHIVCKEGNTTTEYDYSGILKFTEDDIYFYLFTNADMVLRIHKDAFTVGTADEFREFANCEIQNHFGKKEVV